MRIEEIEEWKKKVEDHLRVKIKEKREFPPEDIPREEEALQRFLARRIDRTLLNPHVTLKEIEDMCREAKEWGFWSVVVNPFYVLACIKLLEDTRIVVGVAVGFPLGQNKPEIKAREARLAFQEGAREVDMVINLGALKNGDWKLVYQDIRGVVEEVSPGIVKVILENCYLSPEEKVVGCLIAQAAGAHFVKTSTGFGSGGATVEDVELMRQVVGESMGIKAAGGIRSREVALQMIKAGANRLGTSSGVKIMKGE
ncbi:MAG: deoxyribose-phosphate aldolase [Atribacterota bacterium]|jgi:deoxyribose-phosphate aldolase|nr:deoxyribose-phosphate aldolase [Atribacterota bacterium]